MVSSSAKMRGDASAKGSRCDDESYVGSQNRNRCSPMAGRTRRAGAAALGVLVAEGSSRDERSSLRKESAPYADGYYGPRRRGTSFVIRNAR